MCKPSDYSPFVGRQRLSSFVVGVLLAAKTCFLVAERRLTYAKVRKL